MNANKVKATEAASPILKNLNPISYMWYATTREAVPGPPEVRINTSVNTCIEDRIVVIDMYSNVDFNNGTVMRKNEPIFEDPSMRAAS